MKAITLVGATPHRVSILFNYLSECGPEGEDRERLSALLAPVRLANKADAGEDNAFSDCLSAGEEMGLFRLEGGAVRLSGEMTEGSFLHWADKLMVNEAESALTIRGWVAGAIAWMLTADPLDPLPWGTSSAIMRLRQNVGQGVTYGMTNDSRYQQAVYWARALGYVQRHINAFDVVIADPTAAVSRDVIDLLPENEEVPLPVFLGALGRANPVFDGGRIREEVEAACGIVRDPASVSASLAMALSRLRHRGVLKFRHLSDGVPVHIAGLPEGRASHVTRVAQ